MGPILSGASGCLGQACLGNWARSGLWCQLDSFFKVLFGGGLVLVQGQKQRHLLRRLQSTYAECVVFFTMLCIEVEI